MDLETKYVCNSLQLTPKYLHLSGLKVIMHKFLVDNPWCQNVNVLKVGRNRFTKSIIY